MAKKALIERQKKRLILVRKFSFQRYQLKQQKKIFKLQQFPRDSSYVRLHNRCLLSGRPKGFFRDFKLSRHFLREMALSGLLPGVKKASW
uniref:ribosomal protein S14 n=1 Tax=Halimeda opuntia TaxID=118223 RepID=UPI002113B21B|nr:ribosomal protein S14 [Halimeda opuntia]UTN43230.1 ribosomal protein S14 [Halimeda opuntia]